MDVGIVARVGEIAGFEQDGRDVGGFQDDQRGEAVIVRAEGEEGGGLPLQALREVGGKVHAFALREVDEDAVDPGVAGGTGALAEAGPVFARSELGGLESGPASGGERAAQSVYLSVRDVHIK